MKLFSVEPERKPYTKWVLAIATLIVAAVGALLICVCAGCASARGQRWKATLTIKYANGQKIAEAQANGVER